MVLDWSLEEVDASITSYFAMLELELRGEPYTKAEFRRRLLPLLSNRSAAAVEFKQQNISAVLLRLDFPWIVGYKPAANVQRLLAERVAERLSHETVLHELARQRADLLAPAVLPTIDDLLRRLEKPPAARRRGKMTIADGADLADLLPRRVDYFEMEARNRSLGLAGEEFAMRYEIARLLSQKCEHLAKRVEHVAVTRGDGAGFDILSYETDGRERLIEVKTTSHGAQPPF